MGRDILPTGVPWFYLPVWMAITIPAVVIVGALIAVVLLTGGLRGRTVVRRHRAELAGLWGFVLVPAAAVMVRHVSLYDGIRHVFFLVPPLAVVAGIGWDALLATVRPPLRGITTVVLAAGLLEPLAFSFRNHPHETVYFTPFIGGPRGAFGRFDMDYWGNCVLQAMDWSAQQAAEAGTPVGVAGNAWEIVAVDKLRYPSLWFRRREQAGYHLDIRLLKGPGRAVLDTASRTDVLHRVAAADGTPLCVVLPGPEYPELERRLVRRTDKDAR
jgi:hypothetical protein